MNYPEINQWYAIIEQRDQGVLLLYAAVGFVVSILVLVRFGRSK